MSSNVSVHTFNSIKVLLPLPVSDGYDYLYDGLAPEVGSWVEVPFGNKIAFGVVWGAGDGGIPTEKLKFIGTKLDLRPLSPAAIKFVDWVSDYTVTPKGAILKMVMGGRLMQLKDKDSLNLNSNYTSLGKPELTSDQKEAAEYLSLCVSKRKFSATLLDGVTGSGKTEVFCEAIEAALNEGRQALVMLPEIAMTAALIDRLAKRFGTKPVEWHSGLTEKQRRINWNAIANGEARFVLGARSALFLPYRDLGVIVVDEEHEPSYKQEEGVIYNARDMAVVRARIEKIPVILASATPSLETVQNARLGKYGHVELLSRFGKAGMPRIEAVDLRKEKMSAQNFIGERIIAELRRAFEEKKQSMLFLNRRGYAPLTLCRGCGHRLQCPNCSAWLIEHKKSGRLHCHHCDYSRPVPAACPTCGAEGKFAACGPGIERIAEEVRSRLPDLRCAIMSSDVVDGAKAADELVKKIENHELDLLIGTQIMAKGYHFPKMTFVGVIDADLGLFGGDMRAAERTFQLLQQVSGRSGRAEDQGLVLLQTASPEHPVMKALVKGDRDAFLEAELEERRAYNLPPFSRLASVTVSAHDKKLSSDIANKLAATAPRSDKIRVLGPAPAPFAYLRGKHRFRLMIQAEKNVDVSALLRTWTGSLKIPRAAKIHIDIDPYSFV